MPRGMFTGRGAHFYLINLPEEVLETCRSMEGWEKVEHPGRAPGWTANLALMTYLSPIGMNHALEVRSLLDKNGGLGKYIVEEK